MMAVDPDFEQASREHTERQKPSYKKREGSDLKTLSVQVREQNWADLKAMSAAARISMGDALDRLISREVAKRKKKSVATDAQDYLAGKSSDRPPSNSPR